MGSNVASEKDNNIIFLTNSFDEKKLRSELHSAGISNQIITYLQINNKQNEKFPAMIEEKNPDVIVLNKGMHKSIIALFNEEFIRKLLERKPNARIFYYCDKVPIPGATHLKEIVDLKGHLSI